MLLSGQIEEVSDESLLMDEKMNAQMVLNISCFLC